MFVEVILNIMDIFNKKNYSLLQTEL